MRCGLFASRKSIDSSFDGVCAMCAGLVVLVPLLVSGPYGAETRKVWKIDTSEFRCVNEMNEKNEKTFQETQAPF